MYKVLEILTDQEIAQCREIAASAKFVHGRVSNPHNVAKDNEQLHDPAVHNQTAQLLHGALMRNEDFRNFTFPAAIAPPLITRYNPSQQYGAHADAAYLTLPGGTLRSDISCTIFLSDPETYEGGSLQIQLGDARMSFKLPPGYAIIYPSDTFHQVEKVGSGERLVAITFIQSRVPDPFKRNLLYELNEVAALEGLQMDPANYARLQLVQQQLLRIWGEKP